MSLKAKYVLSLFFLILSIFILSRLNNEWFHLLGLLFYIANLLIIAHCFSEIEKLENYKDRHETKEKVATETMKD